MLGANMSIPTLISTGTIATSVISTHFLRFVSLLFMFQFYVLFNYNVLLKGKEEGWNGFSKGWQSCPEGPFSPDSFPFNIIVYFIAVIN